MQKKYFSFHQDTIILICVSLIAFGIYFYSSYNAYKNLIYGYTDLVYFEQTFDNFLKGNGLVTTGSGEERSLFGGHAHFTYLICLPFYAIFPSALTLLAIGSAHVLGGMIFVFFIAKKLLKNRLLSWVCYVLFMLNGLIQKTAGSFWVYSFHPEVFYIFYFFMMIYFWEDKKTLSVFAFFMALFTRETYAIPLFMTMLYFLIKDRGNNKTALVLMGVSVLYFILATKLIIPFFGKGNLLYLSIGKGFFYKVIEDGKLLFILFSKYWGILLFAFFCIPILSPEIVVLGLPTSLINTIVSHSLLEYTVATNPRSWHAIPIYCFLIWAFIKSFGKIIDFVKIKNFKYFFSGILIIFALITSVLFSNFRSRAIKQEEKPFLDTYEKAKKIIDEDASLSVSWRLGAHLVKRRFVYYFPTNYKSSDYLLVASSEKKDKEKVESILKEDGFDIVLNENGILLLKKKSR